jgi:hypothetical protein
MPKIISAVVGGLVDDRDIDIITPRLVRWHGP